MKRNFFWLIAFALVAAPALAADAPYAGQQNRAIATLSDADIAAIEAGEGWGLALPAELNGWPGPRHVLDMAEALQLSVDQQAIVQRIFGIMQAEAQRIGARYIASERALDAAFENPAFDPVTLAGLTASSANAMGELRMIHLAAHIETRQVLTEGQVAAYNRLRGYGDAPAHSGDGGGGHDR